MTEPHERNVITFNQDIVANQGYLYTTNAQLSSTVANKRLSDIALEMISFEGKKVVDVGCGDGAYTIELYDRGKPDFIYGVDPAQNSIEVAQRRAQDRNMRFAVDNAYQLDIPADTYDIAHVRGVLHHMDRPWQAISEVLRVARQALIIEPNGYNPILKVLEKVSPYHREHDEKSYLPTQIDQWVTDSGGQIVQRSYAGIIPFFAPDWYVGIAKRFEPFIESCPGIKQLSCAVYVVLVVRE